MTRPPALVVDPALDLVLERVVDVPKELVWKAWTTPEIIKKWFTPAPWSTVDCEIDLQPGGIFRTVMQSPEGQQILNVGCWLEVLHHERLVWTSALGPGYRPKAAGAGASVGPGEEPLDFTATVALEAHGNGTKYTAFVKHGDPATRKRHEDMGFHDGWGAALDQLVALVKTTR